MPRMDVMDAVVRVMEDEGVEVAIGVPGAAILPLHKALNRSEQVGLSIDEINEYEPILEGAREMVGRIVGGVPETD